MAIVFNLEDLDIETIKHIRNELTITPKEKKKRGRNSRYAQTNTKKPVRAFIAFEDTLYLPLYYGSQFFETYGSAGSHAQRTIVRKGEDTFKLRDYQKRVAHQVILNFKDYHVAGIQLRPGKGKTATSICVSAHVGLLTCVLLPIDLCDQWVVEYAKITQARTWIVGTKTQMSKPARGKPAFNVDEVDIIICYFKRWVNLPLDVRRQVGLLILDECHMFCNKTGMEAILSFTPRYVLACSATPHRSRDGMHALMDKVIGPDYIKLPHDKMDFVVFKTHTGFSPTRVESKTSRLDFSVWTASLVDSLERNLLIVKLTRRLLSYGRKIFILTGRKRHVTILQELLSQVKVNCAARTRERRHYADSSVLISNIHLSGTGFDEVNFCKNFNGARIDTIILATSIANPELLEQTVGRAFRVDDPMVIHLLDKDSTATRQWREEAQPWYLTYDANIIENKHYMVKQKRGCPIKIFFQERGIERQEYVEESDFVLED